MTMEMRCNSCDGTEPEPQQEVVALTPPRKTKTATTSSKKRPLPGHPSCPKYTGVNLRKHAKTCHEKEFLKTRTEHTLQPNLSLVGRTTPVPVSDHRAPDDVEPVPFACDAESPRVSDCTMEEQQPTHDAPAAPALEGNALGCCLDLPQTDTPATTEQQHGNGCLLATHATEMATHVCVDPPVPLDCPGVPRTPQIDAASDWEPEEGGLDANAPGLAAHSDDAGIWQPSTWGIARKTKRCSVLNAVMR